MQMRIFTLPFDPTSESFPDEIITEFCLNKKVHQIESQFFQHDGHAYWSVSIHYEIVLRGEDKLRELDDAQKLLLSRLKDWRKERAQKDGIPVYLVATNAQFFEMVRLKCRTLESFKNVKGYGKKRVASYGREINELIKAFYESRKQEEAPENSPVDDLPFA